MRYINLLTYLLTMSVPLFAHFFMTKFYRREILTIFYSLREYVFEDGVLVGDKARVRGT